MQLVSNLMIRYSLFFLSLAVVMSSCLKEPQKPSWEVGVVAPLFKTSIGIDSFFADTLLETDTAMQLSIVYRDLLYDFTPDSLLETPDTLTYENYKSPFGFTLQPGQQLISKNEEKVYKFGNSEISFLRIKKGSLRLEAQNTLSEALKITYTIPSAQKDGQVFQVTDLVPAASQGGLNYIKMLDISGYSLDLKGQHGNSVNTISTHIQVNLNPQGSPIQLTTQDELTTLVKFDELIVDYIRGYFEPVDIDVSDESRMDVFDIISSGHIDFENVYVDLLIENGFGIDAQLKIHEIISRNTHSNQDVSLTDPILGQTINIMRAAETGAAPNPVAPTFYPLDFSGSNVKQMLENQPNRLVFEISGLTSPLGNISGGNDFYYDGYGLKIFFNLEIPLSIKADALTLTESFDFSWEQKEDKNKLLRGHFELVADNGFPFDATAYLFLHDKNETIIDTLIFNSKVLAAPLGSNMIVEKPQKTIIEVPVPEEKVDHLSVTEKMTLEIVFDTHTTDYIKLYDFYKIDLLLTGHFDFYFKQ